MTARLIAVIALAVFGLALIGGGIALLKTIFAEYDKPKPWERV